MNNKNDYFNRTIMMLGEEGFKKLQKSFVCVIGIGGVGAYSVEALARSGIEKMRLVDFDFISPTAINRQLLALTTNQKQPKVDVARERLLQINPDIELDCIQDFFHIEKADKILTPDIDFVIDAIDSLSPKVELIKACAERNLRVISVMGASSRTDPSKIQIGMLSKTSVCPLARQTRKLLKSRAPEVDTPVVFSTEIPAVSSAAPKAEALEERHELERGRVRKTLPSLSTLPGIFGLIAANYVILEIVKQ